MTQIVKGKVPCECGRGLRDRRAAKCRTCQTDVLHAQRVCAHCGQPATNPSGPPRCDGCRGKVLPRSKTCPRCDTDFETATGQTFCGNCKRERGGYDTCACGAQKDKRAKHCRPCAGKRRQETGVAALAGKRGAAVRWQKADLRPEKMPDSNGYVLMLAPADHPKATSGRVREHILVMEQQLGRYLAPGENVHHRNGVKDDNRPENLELWSRAQPTGARVADQVAWAREILARYGDEFPADHDSPSNGVQPGP